MHHPRDVTPITSRPVGGREAPVAAESAQATLRPGRVNLCGFPLDSVTMAEAIACIADRFDRGLATFISVVNVAKLVNMRKDALLRESVLSGDLILADGAPLVWLSRWKGTPLPERVAGIDLMHELLRFANGRRGRVYFLGATELVVKQVVAIVKREHPELVVAGWSDGYFSEEEEASVAERIRESRADILLVAMSSPKKERFLARWFTEMGVPVCHGVGGSFDVVAGLTKRAPRWMQRAGLEWLYRVLQEPRRMWKRYLVTNTAFLWLAVRELWGTDRFHSNARSGP